jgi:rare lipoprotein A
LIGLMASLALLAGCARGPTTRPASAGEFPAQTGVASWYGFDFVFRSTASGERFNPLAMTAAHRTLPFGTLVRVTRLDTGASVTVRINDRGPFVEGRIIDLARRPAGQIGVLRIGTARCRLEVLRVPLDRGG